MSSLPLSNLVLSAKEYYSPELPYHNWQHALDVMKAGQELLDRVSGRGMVADKAVIAIAAAWHDAGYHEDHTALG